MERGLLIVFEGLDGCGKSTQLDLLCARLRAAQHEVIPTKEPTDGPVGRRIREMARSQTRVTPEQELEWFMEDRREHVSEVVEPGLAAGAIVLSDRYWLSNVAYQGARGLDAEVFEDIDATASREAGSLRAGDVVLVMSNGDFGNIWEKLLAALEKE